MFSTRGTAAPRNLPGGAVQSRWSERLARVYGQALVGSNAFTNFNVVRFNSQAEARGDFPPSSTDFPPFGAVLSRLRPQSRLPTWVQVGPLMRRNNGTVLHGQSPGFLGARHSPLVVNQDLLPADVRVEAVTPDADTPLLRLAGRRRILEPRRDVSLVFHSAERDVHRAALQSPARHGDERQSVRRHPHGVVQPRRDLEPLPRRDGESPAIRGEEF